MKNNFNYYQELYLMLRHSYLQVKFLEYVGKGQMSSLRNMTDSMAASGESACDGAEEISHSEPEEAAHSEPENFLDVIRRTKNAAHLVPESAVWGSDHESSVDQTRNQTPSYR